MLGCPRSGRVTSSKSRTCPSTALTKAAPSKGISSPEDHTRALPAPPMLRPTLRAGEDTGSDKPPKAQAIVSSMARRTACRHLQFAPKSEGRATKRAIRAWALTRPRSSFTARSFSRIGYNLKCRLALRKRVLLLGRVSFPDPPFALQIGKMGPCRSSAPEAQPSAENAPICGSAFTPWFGAWCAAALCLAGHRWPPHPARRRGRSRLRPRRRRRSGSDPRKSHDP